jgi:putative ABC transport system substrate-binding protein
MRRREFITLLSGAAVGWPLAARGQNRIPLLGVLVSQAESDPDYQARVRAFQEGLDKLGWTEGRNIQIAKRWSSGNPTRMRAYAADLIAMRPDVILATSIGALASLQQATSTISLVFAQVPDPIANGFVTSLAHPGGNISGFANYEQSIVVKWLELLKQLAPAVARIGLIYDPTNSAGEGYVRVASAAAHSFNVEFSGLVVRNAEEIALTVDNFAREPNGALILLPSASVSLNRDSLIAMANRHGLPTVCAFRDFATGGVLASYGVDSIDLFRRSASYVDRILRGEKPGDLPVQFANKFELVINLKTAKALGLEPPIGLLARTDEVIE